MNDATLPDTHGGSTEIPLSSVTVDGTAPEPGDTIDYHVTAKVESVENDCCYVTPLTVNGQEVKQGDDEAAEGDENESLDDMGSRLRSQVDGGY